jgi:hypothetical protein
MDRVVGGSALLVAVSFPVESGYILEGPSQILYPELFGFRIGETLVASYPALWDLTGFHSLDYTPASLTSDSTGER